ncbi:acid-sensing ion channel 4-A-like [Antedon mediterranea]|uniref:acid-sensing ion channel 4-A-like n=1 Tax=Antedon mediterranea TaxID=105859 RepID=UPI003AF597E6
MTLLHELSKTKIEDENGTNVALVVGTSMENISAHGIPNIKRAQYPSRRLLWVFAFLVSFSVCVWQVTLLVSAYISWQITTNLEVRVATTLIFPAVTICNLNGMKLSYLLKTPELHSSLNNQAMEQDDQFMEWTSSNLESREGYFDMISAVTETLAKMPYEDREYAGHMVTSSMLSCNFNGYPCVPANFTFSYNYLYGNCYTFNGLENNISNTSYAGPLYGLTLEMNIQQDEYISDIQPAAGLRILIHDQSEMPFPEDQGVTISPGKETSIGIHRTEFERLPSPYPSDCSDSSVHTLFSELFSQITYSKPACWKDCIYYKTYNHCKCYLPKYTFDHSVTPLCTAGNATQEQCMLEAEQKIAEGSFICDCPPACKFFHKEYNEKLLESRELHCESYLMYNGIGFRHHEHFYLLYFRLNFAKVNVYYENLQYDSVQQVPTYTLLSLVSNIGGHLGLWIGMSALTFLEFLECFYDIMKNVFAAFVRQEKTKRSKKTKIGDKTNRVTFQSDAIS